MLESGNGQVPGPSKSSQQSSPVSAEKIRKISGPIEGGTFIIYILSNKK